MTKHLKSAAFIALYLLIYLAFQFTVMLAVTIAHSIAAAIGALIKGRNLGDSFNAMDIMPGYILLSLIIAAIMSLLFYLIIFKLRKKSLIGLCGFAKLDFKSILLIALTGIALNSAVINLINLLPIERVFTDYTDFMESMVSGVNIYFLIASIGILLPIFEEILFRGMVFNELKRNLPIPAVIIIQGVLFGLYHLNLLQASYATVLGILLGMVYVWFRSIWAPILLHIFFNTNTVLWNQFMPQAFLNQNGKLLFAVSLAVSILGVYLLYRLRLKPQEAVCDIPKAGGADEAETMPEAIHDENQ